MDPKGKPFCFWVLWTTEFFGGCTNGAIQVDSGDLSLKPIRGAGRSLFTLPRVRAECTLEASGPVGPFTYHLWVESDFDP